MPTKRATRKSVPCDLIYTAQMEGRLIELRIATAGRRFRGEHKEQCSFCLLDRAEVDHLLAGPGVSICFRCVARCVAELKKRRIGGWRRWWDFRKTAAADGAVGGAPYRDERSCSFCGQERVAETLFAEHARICSPCVRLSLDVVIEAGG